MRREFWLDGFNFFYQWDVTKGLMRPDSGLDIVKAMERSLRILGRRLGSRCSFTVVIMDGGLSRQETRLGPLRVRYCGPGRKADDRIASGLEELGPDARLMTVVSNDRELKSRAKALGASCLGVGEYLAVIEGKKSVSGGKTGKPAPRGGGREDAELMREKCRSLSATEVAAWLELFGGDIEA